MAFDGITVSNIVYELSELLTNGRIAKIAQPEKDELQLTIKTANRTNYRLLISANASLPLIYLTETNKVSPLTAPNFCMLLRKHLNSCKIISVKQLGLERVIQFELEHLNELGDLCKKYLLVELMGKHSNIIFCDYDPKRETLIIIDSIKRINGFVSSVREVLPGRDYFIPQTVDKQNPFDFDINMMKSITSKHGPISKAIYTTLTGFSPSAAHEICERAYIDSEHPANELSTNDSLTLYQVLENFIMDINHNIFTPNIAYENGLPLEFAVYPMSVYKKCYNKSFESVSAMLEQIGRAHV